MAVVTIHDGKCFIDVEVTDEFAKQYQEMEHRESLIERKETRRHQSLDKSIEHGFCVPDSTINIFEEVERRETVGELNFALKRLTRKQQIVVVFHAIYKLSFCEIAVQFGVSKETVREHYHVAV